MVITPLITAGQDNSTARLTATASETKYLGQTWFPVVGLSPDEAKATAVFANSTPGRLQIMRGPGKKLTFPSYSPRATNNLRVPDIKDERIRQTLADCWERTKDMAVPQFREGECEVRHLWDEAVAEAMGWDYKELAHLRHLLHSEPHVRGLGYGQYPDEADLADELGSVDIQRDTGGNDAREVVTSPVYNCHRLLHVGGGVSVHAQQRAAAKGRGREGAG